MTAETNRQASLLDRQRSESERVQHELHQPGLPIVWKNVQVAIKEKEILKGIYGMAKPGQMIAIMGPSGSGKTTLLNVLSRRREIDQGSVLINSQPLCKRHKRQMAYVLQQDLLFPSLTLKDTLFFTSELMLPEKMSRFEKQLRVDDLVDSLGLQKCLNTKVGNEEIRGLSGGEKKRTNIACEMLVNPRVLMLDEPTTGLDASTARDLVETIKEFARSHHKTVIATIHQPSSRIFYSFDAILLLAEGEMMYFGSPHKIMQHFESAGLVCHEHMNPADFILEQLRASEENRVQLAEAMKQHRKSADWPEELRDEGEAVSLHATADTSENGVVGVKVTRRDPDKGSEDDTSDLDESQRWTTGFMKQMITLTRRNFKTASSTIITKHSILFNLAMALASIVLWFRMPRNEEMLFTRNGMIFHTTFTLAMHPLFEVLYAFPAERPILNKERSAGSYRLSAYYCAKMVSELPLVLLTPTLYMAIVYWANNLAGVAAFFLSLLIITIGTITAQSLGILISASVVRLDQAITISVMYNLLALLLGGFYIVDVPVWISWYQYINFIKYTYDAMIGLEYILGPDVECATQRNLSIFEACRTQNATHVSGAEILDELGVTVPIYACVLLMFGFMFAYRILGYFMLRFLHRPDKRS